MMPLTAPRCSGITPPTGGGKMAEVPDGLVKTPGLEMVGGGGTRFTVPAATGKTSLATPLVETSARLFPLSWVEAEGGFKPAPV